MAKKKSTNKGINQKKLTPERYMQVKARRLPIDKCYVSPPEWKEEGMAHVIVTRRRPDGDIAMGTFLVDILCLGVKSVLFNNKVSDSTFANYIEQQKKLVGIEEISYNEAHNIVYGAIAFAEEAGLHLSEKFYPAGYILEEDTDDIPLIEYEFGRNGKHHLVVFPDGMEKAYIPILEKTLGDNFEYEMAEDDESQEADDSEVEKQSESGKIPGEASTADAAQQ